VPGPQNSPPAGPVLQCAGRLLDLSTPRVMGVLNTTPDSFSDGGSLYGGAVLDLECAMARARAMVAGGAAILDIGGESTRPGARPVSEDEEMERVLPLLRRVVAELDVVVSVDTSSPALMREAAAAGAGMLNDVRALARPGALQAAAETGLPVCLMHMQGQPGSMQSAPRYDDVMVEVMDFLRQRIDACEAVGISRRQLLVDPDPPPAGHCHIMWRLSGGVALVFRDPRRFGGVWTYPSEVAMRTARWDVLGPDALTVGARALGGRLAGTRRPLKAALLDQRVVAGVGNIYADEALHRARLHPLAVSCDVDRDGVRALAGAIRATLRSAIESGGSTLADYRTPTGGRGAYQRRHRVYGRGGLACRRCGATLSSEVIAQRTTVWCPGCQGAPVSSSLS